MEQIKKYSSTTESKTVSAGTKAKFQIPETTQIIQKIEEEEKEIILIALTEWTTEEIEEAKSKGLKS